jgi:hypothetical protein
MRKILKKLQVSYVVVRIRSKVARSHKIGQQRRHACLDELQFLRNPNPRPALVRTRHIKNATGVRIPCCNVGLMCRAETGIVEIVLGEKFQELLLHCSYTQFRKIQRYLILRRVRHAAKQLNAPVHAINTNVDTITKQTNLGSTMREANRSWSKRFGFSSITTPGRHLIMLALLWVYLVNVRFNASRTPTPPEQQFSNAERSAELGLMVLEVISFSALLSVGQKTPSSPVKVLIACLRR